MGEAPPYQDEGCDMRTEHPCAQCGELKLIKGRNLCARCYQGLRNVGKLDRYPTTGRVGRPPGTRTNPRRPFDWKGLAEERGRQLEAAQLVVDHARKWQAHDGALAYALRAYEESKNGT